MVIDGLLILTVDLCVSEESTVPIPATSLNGNNQQFSTQKVYQNVEIITKDDQA